MPWETPVADGMSGDMELEQRMLQAMSEAFHLWKTRHRKYGRLNILMSGEVGCVVRGGDKLARLMEALVYNRGLDAKDETVADSFIDLANYALMGLLCYRGQWSAGRAESEK